MIFAVHRNFTWKILDPLAAAVKHTHTHTRSWSGVLPGGDAKDTAEKISPKNQDGEQPSSSSLLESVKLLCCAEPAEISSRTTQEEEVSEKEVLEGGVSLVFKSEGIVRERVYAIHSYNPSFKLS